MSDSQNKKELDLELAAIRAIIEALSGLDNLAKYRALSYSLEHLNIDFPPTKIKQVEVGGMLVPEIIAHAELQPVGTKIKDIRSLKELKNPSSASEMAALVAYYLSEVAPEEERKNEIDTNDIHKYFKQAGYPLPALQHTLGNASKAGYFDRNDNGYKLNPVGYNLVVHGLPSKEGGKLKNRSVKRKTKKMNKTKKR